MRRALVLVCVLLVALLSGCGSGETAAPATSPADGARPDPIRISYGETDDNFGDLYLPAGQSAHLPVVVLVHGGGWEQVHDLSYMAVLAEDLVAHGVAVWNVEYRRVGGVGGWPVTLADVDDATESLATVVQQRAGGRLDLKRVHVAGHSAGGHLAAWLAGRHTIDGTDAPGADPHVRLAGATIMAGVLDLRLAAINGHDRFVRDLLGGLPDEQPDRYRIASPIEHLPVGLPVTVVHGDQDATVSPDQSRNYARAARAAGDPVTLHLLPGGGHADFGDVRSPAWAAAKADILRRVGV
ncbi:alpha/beta hydrolase [Nocardia cyriacigeorgica]|uniref:alpha/beta hydrolase n=1 Tax=Nocardia cyriacigeorgica TaxID=135487 RepID=UPI001E5717E5|nr:alpha/beta hydrolase [Nocardia cyriacigeorgica]